MSAFLIVLGKELVSFLRSTMLVVMVLYSFTLDIYVAGNGIQIKPRNVTIGYVDMTGGGMSQKILSRLHKPEFVAPKRFLSQETLSQAIFNKEIIVGMVFDSDFEKDFRRGKNAQLNLLLDATAASQSFTTLAYMQNILMDFQAMELPIEFKTHKLFMKMPITIHLWH